MVIFIDCMGKSNLLLSAMLYYCVYVVYSKTNLPTSQSVYRKSTLTAKTALKMQLSQSENLHLLFLSTKLKHPQTIFKRIHNPCLIAMCNNTSGSSCDCIATNLIIDLKFSLSFQSNALIEFLFCGKRPRKNNSLDLNQDKYTVVLLQQGIQTYFRTEIIDDDHVQRTEHTLLNDV